MLTYVGRVQKLFIVLRGVMPVCVACMFCVGFRCMAVLRMMQCAETCRRDLINNAYIQGDQKVSVHLMITVLKKRTQRFY
jgi:hypothetical protein